MYSAIKDIKIGRYVGQMKYGLADLSINSALRWISSLIEIQIEEGG
jgi:hypothetical protein